MGKRLEGRRVKTGMENLVVGAAPGLFLLGGRGWRNNWRRCGWDLHERRDGRSKSGSLRVSCGIVESGGVLEDAAGVFGDGLDAGGIGPVWRLDAAGIGADGFVHLT